GPDAPPDRPRFDAVRVLFPDPWPKTRHRSRRLVDRAFVAALADLLPEGGTLHLATDWDGYALQMVQALIAEPRFEVDATPDVLATASATLDPPAEPSIGSDNPFGSEGPLPWAAPRPPRPVTTYERRGIQAGRRVTDITACRRVG